MTDTEKKFQDQIGASTHVDDIVSTMAYLAETASRAVLQQSASHSSPTNFITKG